MENMENSIETPKILFWTANSATFLLSIIVLRPLIFPLENLQHLFTWHPIFMILGLFSLINGIMVFHPIKPETRYQSTISHFKRQVVSVTLITIGFTIIYVNKIKKGSEHLKSTHGQLGTYLLIFTWLIGLFGILFKYTPNLFGGRLVCKKLFIVHRIAGYLALLGVVFTFALGLQSHWALRSLSTYEIQTGYVSLFIIFFSVCLRREWWNIFEPTVIPIQLPS